VERRLSDCSEKRHPRSAGDRAVVFVAGCVLVAGYVWRVPLAMDLLGR
jgi:hypothetical protein